MSPELSLFCTSAPISFPLTYFPPVPSHSPGNRSTPYDITSALPRRRAFTAKFAICLLLGEMRGFARKENGQLVVTAVWAFFSPLPGCREKNKQLAYCGGYLGGRQERRGRSAGSELALKLGSFWKWGLGVLADPNVVNR